MKLIKMIKGDKMLREIQDLKQQMDQAIQLGNFLQAEANRNPLYELKSLLDEKQVVIAGIEKECQELG